MYKNFYSAQGEVVFGSTDRRAACSTSRWCSDVLHGGGQIFPSEDDPNAKLIHYWITHPAPTGQDEFSTATYSMFTPADPRDRHVQHPMSAAPSARPRSERGDAVPFRFARGGP